MNKRQVLGIVSLGLIGLAVLAAIVSAFATHWWLGIIYLAVLAVASHYILRSFCAKCPDKARCGHVIPGKIAAIFAKPAGPYTRKEMVSVFGPLFLIFLLPQLWIWRNAWSAVVFWGLAAAAGILIRRVVCPGCDNAFCPANVAYRHGPYGNLGL